MSLDRRPVEVFIHLRATADVVAESQEQALRLAEGIISERLQVALPTMWRIDGFEVRDTRVEAATPLEAFEYDEA